jgi:REP element-mobilizing transposase RayT
MEANPLLEKASCPPHSKLRVETRLAKKRKIEVYAFVLMPNHLHFIWQLLEMNGKEKPHTFFLKFTAHSSKTFANK